MTHIYKIANGSLTSAIGDTRLFYTGNYSVHARAVNGLFLDNPPVLSPDYATLVWRYYPDTDRFILIHVQGSQVIDQSQGRNYPYRAAFEVSRDDINALEVNGHLPLSSLFSHIPRIQEFTSTERVEEEHDVAKQFTPVTEAAKNLSWRIFAAFANATPLFITINTDGQRMKENAVFEAPELKTLLTAIEQLPVNIARYATFTFCADEHAASVMDNILINVIAEGANIQIPAGCKLMSWSEAIMPFSIDNSNLDTILTVASALPGSTSPMTPVTETSIKLCNDVKNFKTIIAKKPTAVATDEWSTWFIKHDISEIRLASWDEFEAMQKHMPDVYLTKLATMYHDDALQWTGEDKIYTHTKLFGFNDNELSSKLNLNQLIKLNRKIITAKGQETEHDDILALYTPQNVAECISKYKTAALGPLDGAEKILTQCIEIKKYRNLRSYAFDILYTGVVTYLCQAYQDIDNIDSWDAITKDFWKMKPQDDGNKKKTLVCPLTFQTLKVVFQSRINAMTDDHLLRFTSNVINQYGTTKSVSTLAIIKLFHESLE